MQDAEEMNSEKDKKEKKAFEFSTEIKGGSIPKEFIPGTSPPTCHPPDEPRHFHLFPPFHWCDAARLL